MAFEPHPDANLLAAFAEGGLPRGAHRQVQHHVAHCAACRQVASLTAHACVATTARRLAPHRHAPWHWAGLAAAGLALASVGLWLRAPLPAPPAAARPVARHAPTFARLAATAHLQPPPSARVLRSRALPAPAPTILAAAIAAPPMLPAVALAPAPATFQPAIDFSPLMTGFLDQPRVPGARGQLSAELASWTGNAPAAALNPPATPPPATEAASTHAATAAWPFAAGLVSDAAPRPGGGGPMAPSISSGLGWAISRSGMVLRSIGAGLWAAVPLVPGIRFRALFSSDTAIWAGGLADQLFFSADRGAHWRQVPLPGVGAHPAALRTIDFADPQHGVIAAADGSSWTTADAGLTWTKQ